MSLSDSLLSEAEASLLKQIAALLEIDQEKETIDKLITNERQ
jgi:uncharacterized tellurite resistance protein B-like protein